MSFMLFAHEDQRCQSRLLRTLFYTTSPDHQLDFDHSVPRRRCTLLPPVRSVSWKDYFFLELFRVEQCDFFTLCYIYLQTGLLNLNIFKRFVTLKEHPKSVKSHLNNNFGPTMAVNIIKHVTTLACHPHSFRPPNIFNLLCALFPDLKSSYSI